MARHIVYRSNSLLIKLNNLKDAQTKAAITDASPSVILKDSDDNTLGTTNLTHDSGGDYYGTISNMTITDTMERGSIEVTVGGDYEGYWKAPVDFRDRKA